MIASTPTFLWTLVGKMIRIPTDVTRSVSGTLLLFIARFRLRLGLSTTSELVLLHSWLSRQSLRAILHLVTLGYAPVAQIWEVLASWYFNAQSSLSFSSSRSADCFPLGRQVHLELCTRSVRTSAGRIDRAHVFRLHLCEHGDGIGIVASRRCTTALGELRRNFIGHADGGVRHSHGDALSPPIVV